MAFLNLYLDDSGPRNPDRKPDKTREGRDWFALGGFLIDEEHEESLKSEHKAFCDNWHLRHPLHMTDMLSCQKGFSWLGRLSATDKDRFWSDYTSFLTRLPVMGTACVIDRPGYKARGYLEKFGDNRWLLCRSAFDIVVERATKIAKLKEKRLRVIFESDPGVNEIMKGYFRNIKTNGLAFDQNNSKKYNPLSKDDFARILYDVEHKSKENRLIQVADTFVYTIARQRYDRHFWIYRHLRDAQRLVNFAIPVNCISEMGIKYYCFD